MAQPRQEVKWFAERMERKLKKNDYKGDGTSWRQGKLDPLLKRLKEETKELENEIYCLSIDNQEEIINEAADIANFAMMIADNARRK